MWWRWRFLRLTSPSLSSRGEILMCVFSCKYIVSPSPCSPLVYLTYLLGLSNGRLSFFSSVFHHVRGGNVMHHANPAHASPNIMYVDDVGVCMCMQSAAR
jgi:hypothetical protein